MEISNIFARKVRQRLAALRLGQTEFADSLGISRAMVSNYLSGARNPGADLVCAWARALKTTPNFLLGFEEEESKDSQRLHAIAALICDHDPHSKKALDIISAYLKEVAEKSEKAP